jgi:hypothetical protein
VFKVLFSLLLVLPAFAQDKNVECKCRQVDGEEYACKCILLTAETMPTAFDFSAVVGTGFLSSSGTPAVVKPPVSSSIFPTSPKPASTTTEGTPTGTTTATGKEIFTGPRGGQYHISASGKKVYERKKK